MDQKKGALRKTKGTIDKRSKERHAWITESKIIRRSLKKRRKSYSYDAMGRKKKTRGRLKENGKALERRTRKITKANKTRSSI